jgi:hypothetical protein
MPGVTRVTTGGPKTFTPADNAFVRGGRLVEAVGTDRIQEAGAASVKVLGVAPPTPRSARCSSPALTAPSPRARLPGRSSAAALSSAA